MTNGGERYYPHTCHDDDEDLAIISSNNPYYGHSAVVLRRSERGTAATPVLLTTPYSPLVVYASTSSSSSRTYNEYERTSIKRATSLGLRTTSILRDYDYNDDNYQVEEDAEQEKRRLKKNTPPSTPPHNRQRRSTSQRLSSRSQAQQQEKRADISVEAKDIGGFSVTRHSNGIFNRVMACILAVCALWLTALSVCVYLTDMVVKAPSRYRVYDSIEVGWTVVRQERADYLECQEREQAVCTLELDEFIGDVKPKWAAAESTNNIYLAAAQRSLDHCLDSKDALERGVRVARAMGSVTYSCNAEDQKALNNYLGGGDTGEIVTAMNDNTNDANNYINTSLVLYDKLSAYAIERETYDYFYWNNKTDAMFSKTTAALVTSEAAVEKAANKAMDSLDINYQLPRQCTAFMSQSTCTLATPKAQFNTAWTQIEANVAAATLGFSNYQTAMTLYIKNAQVSYNNMVKYYDSVVAYFNKYNDILKALNINFNSLGSKYDFTDMSLIDFNIPTVSVPSSIGILTNIPTYTTFNTLWGDVEVGAELIADTLIDAMNANITAMNANIDTVQLALSKDVQLQSTSLSATVKDITVFDDYYPPSYPISEDKEAMYDASEQFSKTCNERQSNISKIMTNTAQNSVRNDSYDGLNVNMTSLFDSLGASVSHASTPTYLFAGFHIGSISIDGWFITISSLSAVFLYADIIRRSMTSLRLVLKFWKEGGIGMPQPDARVAQSYVLRGKGGPINPMLGFINILANPILQTLLYLGLVSWAVVQVGLIYYPMYDAYRDGCVTHHSNGTWLTSTLYSFGYNYAVGAGQQSQWDYLQDYDARRTKLCQKTSGSSLVQQEIQMQDMRNAHADNIYYAALMARCIPGVADPATALFAEAANYTETCAFTNATLTVEQDSVDVDVDDDGSPTSTTTTTTTTTTSSDRDGSNGYWHELLQPDDPSLPDCSGASPCVTTCEGPDQQLLHSASERCGCLTEWWLHAWWLSGALALFIYISVNLSREWVQRGLLRVYWRKLRPATLTYLGSCDIRGVRVTNRLTQLPVMLRKSIRMHEASAWITVMLGLLVNLPWLAAWYFIHKQHIGWEETKASSSMSGAGD